MNTAILEPPVPVDLYSKPDVASDEPNWLVDRRAAAWQRFEELPFPARTEQSWRFSSLEVTNLEGFHPAMPVDPILAADLLDRSNGMGSPAMVFANDRLLSLAPLSDELAARGVVLLPLADAFRSHGELIREKFLSQPVPLGSEKFAALHEASVSNGVFLFVPNNVEIELPVEIFHWSAGAGAAVFPHTLLIAGSNSKVTLIETAASASPHETGFACGVNDLFAGPGSKVTYVFVQDWNKQSRAFHLNSNIVERDAAVTNLTLNFGGSRVRGESISRLIAEGGRSDMLAVNIVSGDQQVDQRTLQDHLKPHTVSDLLYKNALLEKANTVFSGLIRVQEGAHFTDAYQKVRNLLLSDEAEANSMPGLEINADQVRCSHGATSGQLDESELFYLLARGIPVEKARFLITVGFLNEVLNRLPAGPVVEHLASLVEERFAQR